jgi:hypothetical protein
MGDDQNRVCCDGGHEDPSDRLAYGLATLAALAAALSAGTKRR